MGSLASGFVQVTVPALSDYENQVLNSNLERLLGCRRNNFKRSTFYDGKRAVTGVSSVIPPQYHNLGLALGWSGKAVDGLCRRAQIEKIVWPEGDLNSLGMAEIVRDNFLLSEISQALTDSALHGVSFLITTQGLDKEPAALVHAKDALNATGQWNVRRRALDNALSVTEWDRDNDSLPTSFVLYLDGLTVSASKSYGVWSVERSKHGWGVPVEPLVYKPRTSRRYGSSRLTRPIMSLHMQALREMVRLEGHMDVYSYPEMWMLGADMDAFRNADGSQKAVWQVMLGRIKGLEDNPEKPDALSRPEVKQFPASSPAPHIETLDLLSRAFAREASLPDSAVALKGTANPTSADAYDASQYELIAEAEGAMSDWSTPVTRTCARALAMFNGTETIPAEWWSIAPQWLGAKFESKAAKADAGTKQLSAVPWLAETEVGLELLGLDPQQIDRALAEKRRAAGRQVLDSLARAPQQPVDDAVSP